MTPLEARLSPIGPVLPTKCWMGPQPQRADETAPSQDTVLREVFRHLFSGGPAYDAEDCSAVPLDLALMLVALAMQEPFLNVLGIIGRGGEFIAEQFAPSPSLVEKVRSALGSVAGGARCIANVNETGAYFQVDPYQGDLSELLVVFYSEAAVVALYWCAMID